MKLPVATCEPRPGRFGPIFAEPTTTPFSTATTVSPGVLHPQAAGLVRGEAVGIGVRPAVGHDRGEEG